MHLKSVPIALGGGRSGLGKARSVFAGSIDTLLPPVVGAVILPPSLGPMWLSVDVRPIAITLSSQSVTMVSLPVSVSSQIPVAVEIVLFIL